MHEIIFKENYTDWKLTFVKICAEQNFSSD